MKRVNWDVFLIVATMIKKKFSCDDEKKLMTTFSLDEKEHMLNKFSRDNE